jgi:hypothetical protein
MGTPDIPNRKLLICPLVAWIINDQLKKKLRPSKNVYSSDKTKIPWKSLGSPKVNNPVNCGSHHLITCKHMFYALSGGYGFESMLNNRQLQILYDHGYGTDDLDFKIYFDAKGMKKTYNKILDKKWYVDFRNDVLEELTKRNIVSPVGIKKITVQGQGVGFATNIVDLFVGDFSSCKALTYFMESVDPARSRNVRDYTNKFAIFSAIHMFMICHAIEVGKMVLCDNDSNRVNKFPKILFRMMVLTDRHIKDWNSIKNDEHALRIQSSIVWLHITQDPSFAHRSYVEIILNMTKFPRIFDEMKSDPSVAKAPLLPGQIFAGGIDNSDDDSRACLSLDASTKFDLFGAENMDFDDEEEQMIDPVEQIISPAEQIITPMEHVDDPEESNVIENIAPYEDLLCYDKSLDDEPTIVSTTLQDGGSADRTGNAVTLLGCAGALIFSTVVGSIRR